jgi:hypothetical protein
MLINLLQEFVKEKQQNYWPDFVIKNSLKEYLQFPVLAFIYSHSKYQNFIFIGGSALRIVHDLPRLSEDLDFNLSKSDHDNINLEKMGEEISHYFRDKFKFEITYRVQGNIRLYLKFPVLEDLGLAALGQGIDANVRSETNFLYVKIEISSDEFDNPEYELSPVSNYGFNFIVRSYSLKYLMTGKIEAILDRQWFKGENNEVDIKGRDYYDLFWYLEKGVSPDFNTLAKKFDIKDMAELKSILKARIEQHVTPYKLHYDLANFFAEQEFITNFCANYKLIIAKYL